MRRDREHGLIRIKTLLGIAVLLAAVYTAAKVFLPWFADSQLKDKMYEEARFAQVNNRTPDQLRTIILNEAAAHDIPLRAQDVKVEMTSTRTRISADYTVTVDLKVYQFPMQFHPSSDR